MASLSHYKDIERSFSHRVGKFIANVFLGIGRGIKSFFNAGSKKITVMFIPHTEKRAFNLQMSFFGLGASLFILIAVIVSLVYSAANYGQISAKLIDKTIALQSTQKDLDTIRDSTAHLVKAAQSFQATLDTTLSDVVKSDKAGDSGNGDLSAFFTDFESGSGSVKEVAEIEKVTNYLERSIEPLNELGASVVAQGSILSEIPNVWPIKGGLGHISMYYGQNEHPIYGSWYFHRGIDLSNYRQGDPVIAAADGKVVTIAFDVSLGNYIVLEHKHGFITRYGHLNSTKVKKGETVKQGQTIGFIGNTGLSTGPHVHYEIHLGTETIDPLPYLNIRSNSSASLTR